MSKFTERYASAIRSGNMRTTEGTTYSDTDVLGAAGIASKDRRIIADGTEVPGAPLAMALMRLLAGDNRQAETIIQHLTNMARDKARGMKFELKRQAAQGLATAVLAWFRDGRCKVCSGHGYGVIHHTTTLSDVECSACRGTGKVDLERGLAMDEALIARWLATVVERELAKAAPAAMSALAGGMDL